LIQAEADYEDQIRALPAELITAIARQMSTGLKNSIWRVERFLCAPDQIYNQWVQEAAENAIKVKFGKGVTLCSAEEDEAAQYLEVDPNATTGMLNLSDSVTVTWYLVRIF